MQSHANHPWGCLYNMIGCFYSIINGVCSPEKCLQILAEIERRYKGHFGPSRTKTGGLNSEESSIESEYSISSRSSSQLVCQFSTRFLTSTRHQEKFFITSFLVQSSRHYKPDLIQHMRDDYVVRLSARFWQDMPIWLSSFKPYLLKTIILSTVSRPKPGLFLDSQL